MANPPPPFPRRKVRGRGGEEPPHGGSRLPRRESWGGPWGSSYQALGLRAYVHTQTASFDIGKTLRPSSSCLGSVHGASALSPRHRHRRAVRWRSDDPPPPPPPCRRPRTARRAMFSQVRLAGVASCCCTLAARSVVATKVRAARARVDENGAAGIISSTITARPTRPVRCYNTYTAAAPCPHPARSQVTTWTQEGRPPPRQPTGPTCGAPLHRRRTAKYAAGRAAVSA